MDVIPQPGPYLAINTLKYCISPSFTCDAQIPARVQAVGLDHAGACGNTKPLNDGVVEKPLILWT